MKYQVIKFKSMEIALKELERFIRDGMHLQNGRLFEQLGYMRSREILANWLFCAALNVDKNRKLMFFTDPTGGDGIIKDDVTKQRWLTEHIFVPRLKAINDMDTVEKLILDAVEKKRAKGGVVYAGGKTLIVFLDVDGGKWFPNKVAQKLPKPLLFDEVWIMALQMVKDGEYEYSVTLLDISRGNVPIYLVHINNDFGSWKVEKIQ